MENRYDTLKPVLDVNAGLDRLKNCRKLYCKLLRSFNVASLAEKLLFCCNRKDYVKMAQKAGSLKSVAEDLGFVELHQISRVIETDAKENQCKEEVLLLLNEAVVRALECVEQFLWLEEAEDRIAQ